METTGNLVGFRWHKHTCGYDWLYVSKNGKTTWKTPSDDYFESEQIRREIEKAPPTGGLGTGFHLCTTQDVRTCEAIETAPMDTLEPIALNFVALPLTAKRALDFANTWGLLSLYATEIRSIPDPSDQRREIRVCAEHASIWSLVHWIDGPIVKLWVAIQKLNKRDLMTYVGHLLKQVLGDDLDKKLDITDQYVKVPDQRIVRQFMDAMGTQDIYAFARSMLADMFNHNVHGNLSSQIVWDFKSERFRMEFSPNSLSGAMSLQLMMAISRSSDFNTCVVCGSWMEISRDVEKIYCSNACRMKAYRQRKAQGRV